MELDPARSESRPNPDPTLLTTQALFREIAALKELIFTRLDATDRALALFQENLTRVPTDTDKQVGYLKELHAERFASVEQQFLASAKALNAALEAAKEATQKAELTTMKQIEQQAELLQTVTGALDAKINDARDRLTSIEGRGSGYAASWAIGMAVLGMVGMIGGIILAVVK